MRRRIAELWGSYKREVLPRNAPDVQVVECRRAFYAGCQGLLGTIMRELTDGPDEQEPDLKMMQDIDRELKEFAVRCGTAAEGKA